MKAAYRHAIWGEPYPDSQKIILLALVELMDEHGCCSPSIGILGRMCSLSNRTVQRVLRDLEAGGSIATEHQYCAASIYTVGPLIGDK